VPDLADTDEKLLDKLRKAGDRWGRLGVALAAARLSDPLVVAAHLRADPTPTRDGAQVHEGEGIAIPETFLPTPDHPAALRVSAPGLVEYDGHELRITYDNPDGTTVPGGLGTDPRRPRPDWYPDDAVTLTYPELRALVALHLDRYCEPGSGRAMRDGDVPLRLAEVLDR
jgi:hypothetical protein